MEELREVVAGYIYIRKGLVEGWGVRGREAGL